MTSMKELLELIQGCQLHFCLFCCFTSQVNSYGHGVTVSSHNHTFFLGKLEQAVNQYFVHILSLVTDNNPSGMISEREENDRRNYFMINLHDCMGPGRDRTRDPWICSQTRICCQTRSDCATRPGTAKYMNLQLIVY